MAAVAVVVEIAVVAGGAAALPELGRMSSAAGPLARRQHAGPRACREGEARLEPLGRRVPGGVAGETGPRGRIGGLAATAAGTGAGAGGGAGRAARAAGARREPRVGAGRAARRAGRPTSGGEVLEPRVAAGRELSRARRRPPASMATPARAAWGRRSARVRGDVAVEAARRRRRGRPPRPGRGRGPPRRRRRAKNATAAGSAGAAVVVPRCGRPGAPRSVRLAARRPDAACPGAACPGAAGSGGALPAAGPATAATGGGAGSGGAGRGRGAAAVIGDPASAAAGPAPARTARRLAARMVLRGRPSPSGDPCRRAAAILPPAARDGGARPAGACEHASRGSHSFIILENGSKNPN